MSDELVQRMADLGQPSEDSGGVGDELSEAEAAAAFAELQARPPAEWEAFHKVAEYLASASPLARTFCPTPPVLVKRESLDFAQRDRLDAHLEACPACREDLADLKALTVEPAPDLLTTLKAKLVLGLTAASQALQILETNLGLGSSPALAPARGAVSAEAGPAVVCVPFGAGELELSWVAARGEVDLQARAIGGAPLAFRVALAPKGAEEAAGEGEGAGVWESRSSDEQGVVALSGLAGGDYTLSAYGPQRRLPDIEVELSLKLNEELGE